MPEAQTVSRSSALQIKECTSSSASTLLSWCGTAALPKLIVQAVYFKTCVLKHIPVPRYCTVLPSLLHAIATLHPAEGCHAYIGAQSEGHMSGHYLQRGSDRHRMAEVCNTQPEAWQTALCVP